VVCCGATMVVCLEVVCLEVVCGYLMPVAVSGADSCASVLCRTPFLCALLLSLAVPCCAMLCHAVPCCAMLCHAVPCYVQLDKRLENTSWGPGPAIVSEMLVPPLMELLGAPSPDTRR
jgi:hypothetical protein